MLFDAWGSIVAHVLEFTADGDQAEFVAVGEVEVCQIPSVACRRSLQLGNFIVVGQRQKAADENQKGNDKKATPMDPLSLVLLVSPACAFLLLCKFLMYDVGPAGSAPMQRNWLVVVRMINWWPYLLGNCLLACSMNFVL